MLKRLSRYLRPKDKGIGHRPAILRFWDTITFAGLRKRLWPRFVRFFQFRTPQWAHNIPGTSPPSELKTRDYFNPIYWIVWAGTFIGRWVVSRPLLSLGPAIPAILVICGLLLVAGRLTFGLSNWRSLSNRERLSKAMRAEDYDVANVCLTNLIKLHPQNDTLRFQKAVVDQRRGQRATAAQTMLRLANDKQDPAAAAWLIQENFNLDGMANWPPEAHTQYRRLMSLALSVARDNDEVILRTNFAKYLIAQGAPLEALRNITQVANRNRSLCLLAAMIYAQIGDEPNTKLWAEQAKQFFASELVDNPDNKSARINLAKAHLLLKEEEQATRELSEGFRLTQDPDFRNAGAEAMIRWSKRLREDAPNPDRVLIRRLQLVTEALTIAPENSVVVEAAVQLILNCRDNSEDEVRTLRVSLLRGISPEAVHFVEGTIALLDGDTDTALKRLDLATKGSSQQMPGLMNNLAVSMYQQEEPKLEEALKLSNAALKILPTHPALRETRGQIYLKMKRFNDAIPDLEAALKDSTLAQQAHTSLAEAYMAIDEHEIARQHRIFASEIAKYSQPND